MMHIIGVMGPGQGATPEECDRAFNLGWGIAQAGWLLLTGGRNVGVMDAASRGAKSAGGLTLGILPSQEHDAGLSEAVDIPVMTGLGHSRNVVNILSSRVVIACGMGLGTASEVALALKVGKPVILLSDDALAYDFFGQCLSRNHLSRDNLSRNTRPEPTSESSSQLPSSQLQRATTVEAAIAQVRHILSR